MSDVFDDRTAERRRDRLTQVFDPLTERFLEAAGIEPGMRVLDLGSGTGDVVLLVSRLVGPLGRVVGIEIDPAAVAEARRRAEVADADNVEVLEGDVGDLHGVSSDFDAVVGRQILMHLADPAAVLRRAAALVRRGGVVAVQEADLGYDWAVPMTPLWSQLRGWFLEALDRAGVEPRMAFRLPRCFADASLPEPALRLSAALDADPDAMVAAWVGMVRDVLPLMEGYGVVTAAELSPGTLADRLLDESRAAGAVVVAPPLVGAWAAVGG